MHGDASLAKLLAYGGRREAQLGTDLAQGPALGLRVGYTLNVHWVTVTSLGRIGFAVYPPGSAMIGAGVLRLSSSAVLAPR
jgi:hypothetical protein